MDLFVVVVARSHDPPDVIGPFDSLDEAEALLAVAYYERPDGLGITAPVVVPLAAPADWLRPPATTSRTLQEATR